jgi:putative ABC transport system permease protein
VVLWKVSLRSIRSRPGRALLTLLSIVIGVAAVVSIGIAASTTRTAYREMFAVVTGRAALEITADGGGSFSESVVASVEKVAGVRGAAGLLQRPTVLYFNGRKIKLIAMGIDPARDEVVRHYELAQGQFFPGPSGALLEARFAQSLGIAPGDEIRLLTRRGLLPLEVSGLLHARGAGAVYMGGLVFLPLSTAQNAFSARGEVDKVQIVLDDGADAAAVLGQIRGLLPAGVRCAPPATQTHLVEQTLKATQHGLLLATSFSLLLATFIILNTFLMNVTERRRQLALLRTIGATRRQVTGLVIGESLTMGALGTLLGILAGLAGARLLTRALDQILMTSLPSMHITPTPFVVAVAMGLGISLVGAWIPARRAGRLSPLEGIDGVVREDARSSRGNENMAGVFVAASSGAAIAASIAGWIPTTAGILAGVILLVGFVLLIPAMLEGLLRLIARVFPLRTQVELRLAHRQIPRHRSRSVLTVGVLFVAASTGVAIASAVLDNMKNVKDWYRRAIVGDFFIRAMMPDMATGLSADLPEALGEDLRSVPGIRSLDALRFVAGTAADQPVVIIVRDFAEKEQVYFDLRAGDADRIRDELLRGDVVIGTVLAQRIGVGAGDLLTVATRKGPQQFRIAGLANDYLVGGLSVYMARPTARQWLQVDGVDGYVVRVDPQARAEVQAELQRLCDKHGVLLHSWTEIAGMIDRMMTEINACLWGILVLGFVVAGFGVFNTLTMNVLEQTRELGLLRVIAMTRQQIRKTILSQAVILGSAGIAPGTVVGLGLAYLINLATMTAIGHPVEFQVHPPLVVGSFVGAFVMVLFAAWLPAERAARLNLTEALQYE